MRVMSTSGQSETYFKSHSTKKKKKNIGFESE